MKLRVLAVALALLLFAGGLCGCKKQPVSDETTGTTDSGASDYGTLGEKDWGGRTCAILGVSSENEPSFEIYVESFEEAKGDTLSQYVYRRNEELKALFKVEILQKGDEAASENFGNNILSGAADYDIAFLYRDDMALAIARAEFKDILSLKHIDISQPYYNSTTIDSMLIGGKLFHMVSDFSLTDKNRIATLYLNRTLAAQFGIYDIIDDVKAGSWTFEKFETYVKEASLDLNSDDKMTYTDDRFGVTIGSRDESIAFWSAMGAKTVSMEGGQYNFDYSNTLALNAAEKVKHIFTDSHYYFASEVTDNYEGAGQAFKAGRALFYGAVLSSLPGLRSDCDFSYTVLPYPKYDEEQTRYYSNNNNRYCATFGVPICAQDPDFSAFMIEALSWKSTNTTLRAFYDVNCKLKHSYDQDCSDMIDVLFDALSFDFGLLYDENLKVDGKTPKNIVSGALRYNDGERSLSSAYAAYADAQDALLKQVLRKILK